MKATISVNSLSAAGGVFKRNKKSFWCHYRERAILVVFNISCNNTVCLLIFLSSKILNGILKVFKNPR